MKLVIGHLVGNAVRFTPPDGKISLTAKAENGWLLLGVQDTGPGIPLESLPFVFERFYRGDESRQQTDRESGLGLAIAKSIVELHGGTITVESAPGEGTKFSIKLPVIDDND